MSSEKTAAAARRRLESGLAELKAGDAAGAERAFRDALALRPGESTALYLLGVVRLKAQAFDEAERQFAAVLDAAPRHAASWHMLASLLARRGAGNAAVDAYRRFLDLEPGSVPGWIALSQALLATGDPDGALQASREAARLAPDNAQALVAQGAALAKQSRATDAAAAYRTALALEDTSAPAHLGLAMALLQGNQPEAALAPADRALTLDGGQPLAWFALGLALRGVGDLTAARRAFTRATELDGKLVAAQIQLGSLCDELDDTLASERAWLAVAALDPADKAAQVALGSLYCRAERYDLGRAHVETALALDSDDAGAHRILALLETEAGREDQAKRHRDLAFAAGNLFAAPAARPRRDVLVLAGADRGNSPDRYLLPAQRYSRFIWFVEYANDEQFAQLPRFDVVFNAIGDPDGSGASAPAVQRFLKGCPRPVLNPPDKIARTARHLAPSLFADIRGLVVPKTARVVGRTPALAYGLRAPVLLRPLRSHGGAGMELIDDLAAFDRRLAAMAPDDDHYATEFFDYRSDDGLYRKYRMFFVDRRPYPYHLAISNHWLVHYDKSRTPDHPKRLAEERRFLEDPQAALGKTAYEAIAAAGRRLDLEFAGVDFSLTSDGRALLFEANATMLVHTERADGPLAHKNASTERILQAFWTMLESAAPKLAA